MCDFPSTRDLASKFEAGSVDLSRSEFRTVRVSQDARRFVASEQQASGSLRNARPVTLARKRLQIRGALLLASREICRWKSQNDFGGSGDATPGIPQ